MAYFVGDTISESFYTGQTGETFTRSYSYIAGSATTFNPTFTELGDGWYRYSYAPALVGIYEWVGTGSASGAITINFDVDEAADQTGSGVAAGAPTAATSRLGPGGPQPALLPVPLVIVQGANWSLPMRLLADGELVDTTAYSAGFTVRGTLEGGQLLFASVANGKITVGFDPGKRASSTAYGLGQRVVPYDALNGYVYEVTTAGTSHSSPPTWPTTIGATVTDGTVTWTNVGTDSLVTNLRIALVPTDTDDVEAFGPSYFDLQIIDDYDNEYIILEGNTVLRRAITRPAA